MNFENSKLNEFYEMVNPNVMDHTVRRGYAHSNDRFQNMYWTADYLLDYAQRCQEERPKWIGKRVKAGGFGPGTVQEVYFNEPGLIPYFLIKLDDYHGEKDHMVFIAHYVELLK